MAIKFTNNVSATLASSITATGTSIAVSAGQGAQFPTLGVGDYFYATLIDSTNNLEIVKVTARTADTLTVVRGQDGTAGRVYAAGAKLELRVTAAGLEDISKGINIGAATTAKAGLVQLTNSISSTSTTTAAVPANVKTAYDLAAAAMPKAGGEFTGQIDAPEVRISGATGSLYIEDRAASANTYRQFVSGNVWQMWKYISGNDAMMISCDNNGDVTAAGSFVASSDERLKSDIQQLTDCLQVINGLSGKSYIKNGQVEIGLIAQQVQKVLPQVVKEGSDGYLAVAYGNIVAVLIEAIKELSARVEQLESKE